MTNTTTERIVLTGFMGSGKSTVGRLLAERLGWTFTDLDEEVERRTKRTVPEIFATSGEDHFRSEEVAALAPLLRKSNAIIALGGGAPETVANRELLAGSNGTLVVYLDAPFETLHDRCAAQAKRQGATARPLLADRDLAASRFDSRKQHYEAVAGLHLDTAKLGAMAAADAILATLS